MELYKLQYFLGVANTEHVQRAAEILHVSPSALSKAISSLEEELGVRLFERAGRTIKLTPSGRHLARRSADLLDLEKTVRYEVGAGGASLDVTIAGREFLLAYYGLVLCDKILKEYGSMEATFFSCSETLAHKAIEQGKADFAITTLPPPAPFLKKCISSFSLHTVVGPNHPLATRARRSNLFSISEVLEYPFVAPSSPMFLLSEHTAVDGWRDDKFPRKKKWTVESVEILSSLIASGKAVAYVPDYWADQRGFLRLLIDDCHFECKSKVYLTARHTESGSWTEKVCRKFTKM